MKILKFFLVLLFVNICAKARIMTPFSGWDQLKSRSPYIFITCCGDPTLRTPDVITINATKSDSNIRIIVFLKGTNNIYLSRLLTDHSLHQGESYLVFGNFSDGICQAFEDYRVIPLGVSFSTNSIGGKSLDDQIQICLQQSLENVNRQIKLMDKERQRLEEGLKR